jgi:hypothetical protein
MFNMEEAAKTSEGDPNVKVAAIPLPLLQKQARFFDYTIQCLMFATAELDVASGIRSSHSAKVPQPLEKPNLYSPLD